MANPQSARFKLLLLGDDGVGKTAFVKRYQTNTFEKSYVPTMGVEVNPLYIQTSMGRMTFNVWDVAGQERFAGLGVEGYAVGADAALIFCDLTRPCTFKSYDRLYKQVDDACPGIPVIFVGNKCDVVDRRVTPDMFNAWLGDFSYHNPNVVIRYYDMSVKSSHNLDRPLLAIARSLMGDARLTFTEKATA